jgi:hypothetical protein
MNSVQWFGKYALLVIVSALLASIFAGVWPILGAGLGLYCLLVFVNALDGSGNKGRRQRHQCGRRGYR